MKLADIKVSWTPSVSTDVVEVKVILNNLKSNTVTEVDLPKEAISHIFTGLNEKTSYLVTVRLTDGTNEVDTSVQIDVPDLEKPQPVSNLNFEIVDVYDLTGPVPAN